jgi:hypothetical protein
MEIIMNYMTTYTGKRFTPLNPDIYQIDIDDIAHALSLMCRGNGHIKHFYSVAQHSLNCAKEARARKYSKRVQLACLLHDGSEAYLSDITRPVKKYLTSYLEMEEDLQGMIYIKYLDQELEKEELSLVRLVDDDMLMWEYTKVMNIEMSDLPRMLSAPKFDVVDFKKIEEEFKAFFESVL